MKAVPLWHKLIVLAMIFIALSPIAFATKKTAQEPNKNCADYLEQAQQWNNEFSNLHSQFLEKFGYSANPWLTTFSLETALARIEDLSFDQDGPSQQRTTTIVSEARTLLSSTDVAQKIENEIYKKVKDFAVKALEQDEPLERSIFQSMVALEFLQAQLSAKIPADQTVTDFSEDQNPDQTVDSDKEEKTQEDDGDEEQEEPDYPELSENYKSENGDTDSGKKNKQEKMVVAQVNEKVNYFKQINHNVVAYKNGQALNLAAEIPNYMTKVKSGTSSITLRVNLGKKRTRKLFFPDGYEPLMPLAPDKLTLNKDGSYTITSSQQYISLMLRPADERLTPIQIEFFKKPVGVNLEQWPAELQSLIKELKRQDPLTAARRLESFMRNKLLYRVDKNELGPIESVHAGSIQCSYAGWIMVAILRDILGIPSRTVSGYNASKDPQNSKHSILRIPATAHMWTEVYHNGAWHTFDGTPVKKDRKTQQEADPDGLQPNQKDFDDEFAPDSEQEEESDSEQKDKKQGGQKSDKKIKKKEQDSGKDSSDEEGKVNEDSKKEKTKKGKNPLDKDEISELLEELTIGSQSMKHEPHKNKLFARALRVMVREALSLHLDTATALQRLLQIKSSLKTKNIYDKDIQQLIHDAEPILQYRQGPAADALSLIKAQLRKGSLNSSYKQLLNIEDRVKLYLRVLSSTMTQGSMLPKEYQSFLKEMAELKKMYFKLIKPGFEDVNLVEKFLKNVPSHTAMLFRQRHKIQSVGFNAETKAAAKSLRGQRDADYKLIKELYPMTNFIMDSVPTAAFKYSPTWITDNRPPRRSYMPLTDLADARRAIRTNPHESYFDSIKNGTAFVKRRRIPHLVNDPSGITDPHRVTIVLYDLSGSMTDYADYQAGLIAAFVDRALSDRSRSGVHRHKAKLMGFGTTIEQEDIHTVLNSQDAYNIISNFKHHLRNKNQGTDIQMALEQAFLSILDAQTRNGEPLAAANIILMSDGGSTVDLKKLSELRAKISKNTPVKMMFVGIAGFNKDLVELANNSAEFGAQESYYFEKTAEEIAETMAEADKPMVVDTQRDYHSDSQPSELDQKAENQISKAAQHLQMAFNNTLAQQKPQTIEGWIQKLDQFKARKPIENRISEIDSLFSFFFGKLNEFKPFENEKIATLVIDNIYRDLSQITGRTLESLDIEEMAKVKWLSISTKKMLQGHGFVKGGK